MVIFMYVIVVNALKNRYVHSKLARNPIFSSYAGRLQTAWPGRKHGAPVMAATWGVRPLRYTSSFRWKPRLVVIHAIITVTSQWAWWRLKSPASRLFTQPFIQVQIKENIKALCHWPLCGEFTGDRWIPAQMPSNAETVSIWWRHHDNWPSDLNKLA